MINISAATALSCSGLPSISNSDSGNCTAGSQNGTACIPVCSSGYNGTLTAVCMNGVWNWTGSCIATNSPTPTPTPVPIVVTPTPTPSNNNGVVTYTFDIEGTSSNNCTYVNNTVVPNLITWGQSDVATNGATFSATLTDCNNINSDNSNNGIVTVQGSTWTIEVVVSGVNADSVIIDENSFETTLTNQLDTDSSVNVVNISANRNSGFFMQASVFALLAVVLTAIIV